MAAFDFLLILPSFVTALALSQVLTSAGRMLVERRRVRRPGLLGLAMLNAATQVYICWLALWDYRDTMGIDLAMVTLFFVSAVLIYLFCVAVSPEIAPASESESEIDLETIYWANHRLFYGTYAALVLLFIVSTADYLRTPHPELFVQQALANLPFLSVALVAIFVRHRLVQWVAGLAMFAMSVGWAVAFSWTF